MKKILLLVAVHSTISFAQIELIPNPGFEEVSGCPGANVFLSHVNYWDRIENHYGTPDQFYGDCDYNGIKNLMAPGQKPYEGIGYVGSFCYGSDLREYIIVRLKEPMIKDSLYQMSFYVLPAIAYGQAINSYGVHFSVDAPKGDSPISLAPLLLEEHIGNPMGRMIDDTVNWTQIKGFYWAKGGEQYATFGNFRKDIDTKSYCIKENCVRHDRSYLLLDGVSLKKFTQEVIECQPHPLDSTVYKVERKLIINNEFRADGKKVRVTLWDHMQIDRDTINVLLNNVMLLSNLGLDKKKTKLKLELNQGIHLLKLEAVNLGKIPPNTIQVRIKSGKNTKIYTLHSDMKETECISILVE